MAQKKNKDRKTQLNNFKQKTKKRMNEQELISEMQNLKSYPVWASQDKLEVTGLEWEGIFNALNIFREGIVAAESVMQRGMEQGKITMKYVDAQGKEVPTEKVAEFTTQMQAILKARQAEQDKANKVTNAPTSPILTAEGEKQAPSVEVVAEPEASGNTLRAV